MHRVTKEFKFCFAHRLLDHPGRCRKLHGHNARVAVTLESADLNSMGMVADFGDIKATVGEWIDEWLDHHAILRFDDPLVAVLDVSGNEVFVMNDNPTCENIARLIFNYAATRKLPVAEVVLWETDSSSATYKEVT